MNRASTLLAPLALLVAGCTTMTPRQDAAAGWLPAEARSSPQRHVVVTVRNAVNAAALGVGSTPRGYSGVPSYTASREARSQARALADQYRLQPVAEWPITVLNVYCLVYRIGEQTDRNLLLADLRHDPRVESAQALESFSTQTTSSTTTHYNDTYAGLQRNLDELAVPEAQRWSLGRGVRVAVIDTGVAVDHADLQGRIAESRNFVDDDATQFRRDRHGTAVAGVIAAVANNNVGIVGIAPEVGLLAYKACWETAAKDAASCNTFTLARALAAAIEARADIVNLSLAGPDDPLLTRLVRSAQRAGIIFVGAAPPAKGGFPIDIEDVIGVETSEARSRRRGLITAPGEDIFTLTPAGHYDAASGSSLAAAEVSAMVALLHARDRRLDAARARRLLEGSERPFETATGVRSAINACEAIAALDRRMSCRAALRSTAHQARQQ